jgi:hypothetical protein
MMCNRMDGIAVAFPGRALAAPGWLTGTTAVHLFMLIK